MDGGAPGIYVWNGNALNVTGKVIVITGKDPTVIYGGLEAYARSLGRAVLRAGYEPHIFCGSDRSGQEETAFGTLHRAWTPVRPIRSLMVALLQPFVAAEIDRFIGDDAGPHLIHSIGSFGGMGVAAANRLRRRGIEAVVLSSPFTTCAHEAQGKMLGLARHYSLAVWLQHHLEQLWIWFSAAPNERRGFRGSDLVLPNYDHVQAMIEQEFGPGINFGKTTYASEMAFLKEASERPAEPEMLGRLEPRSAPLIVSVSRHDLRKGLDVLLRALVELRTRGIPFRACLVGGGQLLKHHQDLVVALGLTESTVVTGKVPDAYVYLQHADIFVLPSLEEGSGSVALLEAMQAGAAPIVSRLDGLPEDVTDGESAIFVTPGDVGDLADALGRCLADAVLRARLAAGAQARFRERYSASHFAADITRIYTSFGFQPAAESVVAPDPGR